MNAFPSCAHWRQVAQPSRIYEMSLATCLQIQQREAFRGPTPHRRWIAPVGGPEALLLSDETDRALEPLTEYLPLNGDGLREVQLSQVRKYIYFSKCTRHETALRRREGVALRGFATPFELKEQGMQPLITVRLTYYLREVDLERLGAMAPLSTTGWPIWPRPIWSISWV